jgi:hypothetical protein
VVEPYEVLLDALMTADGTFVSEAVVELHNFGEEPLNILGYAMDDPSGTFTVTGPGASVLQPGDATTLVIGFHPTDFEVREAQLKIATTDPGQFEVSAWATGQTRGPQLELSPVSCEQSMVPAGCSSTCSVLLSNPGTESLRIDSLQLEGSELSLISQQSSAGLADTPDIQSGFPWYLGPGRSMALTVEFAPTQATPEGSQLHLKTNAALSKEISIDLPFSSTGPENITERHSIEGGVLDILVLPRVDSSSTGPLIDALESFMAGLPDWLDILDVAGADWRMSFQISDDGCIASPTTWAASGMSRSTALWNLNQQFYIGIPGLLSSAAFTRAEQAVAPTATMPGGCNAGWKRNNARLALVGISDTAEGSAATWQDHVLVLEQLAAADVEVYAFAGDIPSTCSDVEPGTGWVEATAGTGGMFYSICEDISSNLENMARALVDNRSQLGLSGVPIPSTLRLEFNGALVESGWHYIETSNSISFDKGHEPVYGSQAVVEFEAEPVCP